MFAGISNLIWGNSGTEEPHENDASQRQSSAGVARDSSGRNSKKSSSKSLKKTKQPESTVTSDSGDESDSWVLVGEPSKATSKNINSGKSANGNGVSSTKQSTGNSGCNSSGKLSNINSGRNAGATGKSLSRRSTTRVLVSSSSQVPVKVAPVRRPLRRHRQVSEQSLEEFPSLANDDKSLGSGCKGEPNVSTTYAQVLATANSTSSDESSSNISICKKVDLVVVNTATTADEISSLSSPNQASSSSSSTDHCKVKPAILVIDREQQQLVKKKGTGSPKSKKSRRHEATDEEWFMTPPPCFTRPNTFDMVKSPIEDMLIEQPIPSPDTPSTPSSFELDSCSLSSRESSLDGRGRSDQVRQNDDEEEKSKKTKKEGGTRYSLEKAPTPVAFTDFQGDVEGKEEDEKNKISSQSSMYKKKEDIKVKSKLANDSTSVTVVSNANSSDTTASKASSSLSSEGNGSTDGARQTRNSNASSASAVREGRRYDEEEEENNENWQTPVVKARQRLNSKGRLALDTYTVVSRKERRKKKKTSPKCNNNGNSNNCDGTNGEGKNSSDWSRPSWSDASLANGSSDAVGSSSASTASFAPALKYMLKAVNRANQQKLQWNTNTVDAGQCKSGPVRRKDKYAARPHSFSLNRKTNRNF